MIRDNQKTFNQLHVVLDGLLIAASYILAWYCKFVWINMETAGTGALDQGTYFSFLYYIIPGYLIIYYFSGLYYSKRYSSARRETANLIKANVIGLVILFSSIYVFKIRDVSRGMIMYFFFISLTIEMTERMLIRKALRGIRRRGYNTKYVLLVGYSRAAEKYIDRILENPQWGYVVCGILDDRIPAGTLYRGVKVLGKLGNLEIVLPENKLDEIGVTLALQDYGMLEEIVNICEKSGVHTKFIPDYNSVIPSSPYIEDLTGLTVVNIRHVPLSNTGNALIKRMADVVGSLLLIILFSPLMIICALLIRITDRGPAIFTQERVGLHNRNFMMYKFRSMRLQVSDEELKCWTKKGDPRVTSIGRFIRRTSLDELPQLFNVLKGDMSLVGPRPERPQFVEKFKEDIPRYMIKHQVRPGMTGWAQINGYRGDTSIRKRIEHDLYYIENWSIGFDIKILFLTLFKGFINKNAY
ncbi:Undecaprenyl-phosphate glucose phosphotransferase [Lachnospiraceae bacterium XPB1003]|nr:Undecaprenyl-phosphate glucose phosphotransferase [Lachnospiraceae bacterium XPB1003]